MNPVTITHWLRQPHAALDADALHEMIRQYPYFPVARYMKAGLDHAREPYSAAMMADMELYKGNRLYFSNTIESVGKSTAIVFRDAEKPAQAPLNRQPEPDPVPVKLTLVEQKAEPDALPDESQPLIQPLSAADYFRHEGIRVSSDLDDAAISPPAERQDPKALMVMMSFADWLMHYKQTSQRQQEEEQGKRALKAMWQQEKLAAALEEESDEIPEGVFEMAVNSITKEDGLASESLAEILVKQEKWDKALDMYRRLSLRNPQKSAYFAQQISAIQKHLDS